MDRRLFFLSHPLARRNAAHACATMPDGWMVTVTEPKKKRIQEEKYHAMIGDIARQATYIGRKWDVESMKRILVNEFEEAMKDAGTPLRQEGHMIPSENGRHVIALGIQTRDFTVKEAAAFVDFLYAWGADRDVVWSQEASV